MYLPAGTKVYMNSMKSSDSFTIFVGQNVYILDDTYDDGWVYIMTENGEEGYVNKQEVML